MSSDISQDVITLTDKWRDKPMTYIDECLGIEKIWKLQEDLISCLHRAIAESKPIFIGSGHSLGKDYICGAIANWFLDCFIPSKVILTAPSDRQVKKIMWAETLGHFNRKKVKLWGTAFTNPYIEVRKEDWFLIGFATKDTGASKEAGGGKFQGLRAATNMCIIVTEAQAIEDNINDQIDAVATGERVLRIYLGNPTRSKGFFARGLRDKVNNITFNFSCLDNPNYVHRKIMVPGLATYAWVEDKRRKWGEDDPRWISRVLGQIPDNAMTSTFPQAWIDHCISRWGFLSRYSMDAGVALDVAGEGDDDNVIMSGKGGEIIDVFTKTLMTPRQNAEKALEMCKAVHGKFIIVDCDGMGIRDYQELCNMPEEVLAGIQIIKFHGSSTMTTQFEPVVDPKTGTETKRPLYQNLRAEASFVTRDRGYAGKCTINPHDRELIEDLTEEGFLESKKGLIQIEDKDEIKDRLDRSPGRGDAYKMLQWAFEQNYEDLTYKDTRPASRLPAYGRTDADIQEMQTNYGELPAYGRAD